MSAKFGSSLVGSGRSERAVRFSRLRLALNDRFDDIDCIATMSVLHMRTDAARAKVLNRMTAKSASPPFEGGRRLHMRRRSALLHATAAWSDRKAARSVDFANVAICAKPPLAHIGSNDCLLPGRQSHMNQARKKGRVWSAQGPPEAILAEYRSGRFSLITTPTPSAVARWCFTLG